ncbi:G patch domain-containing protein 4 [Copidosoma floridanum]|uniref:G patch domain-containing protein 4 n=1 Tax=Copidosoma floridanum TaxID=29053 RepID=UPI0006C9DB79|nr:G patch domain-containing protein 4 [Copidosoma floridanum]
MAEFAKAQLQKYGWIEGKGLGKNENGITQALKPQLKFDTSGVGHKDSDYQWWSSVYNKAASNIVLEQKADQVSISVADKNAVNISSKEGPAIEKASLYHGNFLKTSTLQDGNLIKDSTCQSLPDKEEKESSDPFQKLTDEELFKACGGRTAHKGARHGLTLSGKLSRIAEQEEQFLANGGLKSCKKGLPKDKRDKKKNKHTMNSNSPSTDAKNCNDLILPVQPIYVNENYVPTKRAIRRNKRKMRTLVRQLNTTCIIQNDNAVGDDGENSTQDTSKDGTLKKCKKKTKKIQGVSDTSAACLLDDDITMEPIAKKKKENIDSSSSTMNSSCDTADSNHICKNCDPFYDYHKKQYEKFKNGALLRNLKKSKKIMSKKEFMHHQQNENWSTAKKGKKLNSRSAKLKKKEIQKQEKKKKLKNLIRPAKLKIESLVQHIDEALVKLTKINIGD